jgi:outer membrane biosynthesis protein TonB
MALSDDQKAMLRLLAQREQGYDDIAALMGLSVDEVRARVKDALAQLEEEGATPPPLPAEPAVVEPEPVEEPTRPAPSAEPEPVQPAAPVTAEPITTAKAAGASPAPEPATQPKASKRTAAPRPRVSLPASGSARAAIAAGAVVLVALIIVIAVSGGSSGSGNSTTAATETTTASSEGSGSTPAASKEVTQATLSAVDGSDAKGVAVFGRVKNSLALQVEATGLAPTGKGQSYAIWLYDSPMKRLPLATTAVTKSGKIGAQLEVPTEVLAYLANETFNQLDISLTSDAKLKAALDKATKEKKSPAYTGTDVLRGEITGPIIGAAKKTKE